MISGHTTPAADLLHPEVGTDTHECTKLVRKLRWIGLDEEADRLERALCIIAPEQRGSVFAHPSSTD